MTHHLSDHAKARLRQRGLREQDLAVILDAGTSLDTESVLLLDQDVKREVRRRKHEIAALERLRGCRVVLGRESSVVTVYRVSERTIKRLMRGIRRRPRDFPSARDTEPSSSSKR